MAHPATELLLQQLSSPVTLVDVGARGGAVWLWNEFGDKARLICFEADPEECERLNQLAENKNAIYVPYALFEHDHGVTLNITDGIACSSVYAPKRVLYERYPACTILRPIRTITCPSIRLDRYCDENNIVCVDAIKLDTQGSELDAIKGATKTLKTVSLIDIEVEFNELYEGQPTFCDVDFFLRSHGFVLWRINNLAHYSTGLVEYANSGILIASAPGSFQTIGQDNGQLFWAQAHYVRREFTPTGPDIQLDTEQALKAAILVGQYGHWDLSLEILRKSNDSRMFDLLASIVRPCSPQIPISNQLVAAHAEIADLRRKNAELRRKNDGLQATRPRQPEETLRDSDTMIVAESEIGPGSEEVKSAAEPMGDRINGKRTKLPLLDPVFGRLSARISPLVRTEVIGALIPELERYRDGPLLNKLLELTERTLAQELPQRVEGILAQELPRRVEGILAQELPQRVEGILAHELPQRVDAIVDSALSSKLSQFYRPNKIVAGSGRGKYMGASNALARDFFHPEYQEFCRIYNEPVKLHRKWWEWAFIYERLNKAGMLRPGSRGLGFGVGFEKLPALFASLGVHVTATDAPVGLNWNSDIDSAEHKGRLFHPEIIDREVFDRQLSFEHCDMNAPGEHLSNYDFCWSSCSFEHLGSIQNGIDFVVNSLERNLKVGGIACHTTELNLSSDDETVETGVTVLYRKKDLERLCRTLEERGHWVEPLSIEPGDLPPDYIVDVPPYHPDPHLKLLIGSYVSTSVGIVARRGR